jgi:hypothetical protein
VHDCAAKHRLCEPKLAVDGVPGSASDEVVRPVSERELRMGHGVLCAEALDADSGTVPVGGMARPVGARSERAKQVGGWIQRDRAGVVAEAALQLLSDERVTRDGGGMIPRPASAAATGPPAEFLFAFAELPDALRRSLLDGTRVRQVRVRAAQPAAAEGL